MRARAQLARPVTLKYLFIDLGKTAAAEVCVSFLFGLGVTFSGSFHNVTGVIMDSSLVHSCVRFGTAFLRA